MEHAIKEWTGGVRVKAHFTDDVEVSLLLLEPEAGGAGVVVADVDTEAIDCERRWILIGLASKSSIETDICDIYR